MKLRNYMKARLQHKSRAAVAIFVLAFVIRVVLVLTTGQYRIANLTEAEKVAISVAESGVFGNPYAIPTGETAHVAPAYPFLLSGLYYLFGTGREGELAKELFCALVSSIQYALLPFLAEVVLSDTVVGIVAGFTGACVPVQFWNETRGGWENNFTAIGLILVCISTMRVWMSPRSVEPRAAVSYGLLSGIVLLFSPVVLAPMVGMLAASFGLAWRDRQLRRFALSLCCAAITIGLILLPWTLRNHAVFGQWIFLRSNLGLELSVSNNDIAGLTLKSNDRALDALHPHRNPAQAERLRTLGEPAFNREHMIRAKQWIATHPERFASLTLARLWAFWFPEMRRPWQSLWLAALSLLALVGLVVCGFEKLVGTAVLANVIVVYPCVYYFVQADPRYAHPIQWALLVLSCYTCIAAVRSFTRSMPQGGRLGRVVAAAGSKP